MSAKARELWLHSQWSEQRPFFMLGLSFSTLIRSQLGGTLPMRRATVKEGLRWFLGAPGLELSIEGVERRVVGPAEPVGTHLADMLCEAVPRARRPSTHRPKHSVTNGEFQSWSTGCGTRTPHYQSPAQTWNRELGVGVRAQVQGGEKAAQDGNGTPGCVGRHNTGSTQGAPRRTRAVRGRRGEGHSPHPRLARRWGPSRHSQAPAQAAGLLLCPRGPATLPAWASDSHNR